LFFSIDLALLGLNYYIVEVLIRKINLIDIIKTYSVMLMFVFVLSLFATLKFADWGNVGMAVNFI
jgi:hypothetical protein